jgi:type I restriction enzyme S subunit
LESYSISNEFGFIPQNEQFEKGGTMSNADKRMYYIVTPDSFAYNPARINVGSIGYDDLDKDVIVSSLYVVFKTDKETHNPFLSYWFKTPMFKKLIELYQEGGVRLYFFYDKLCQCHFRRPCLAEQQKIATYFTCLDKQISLQEARLEKLKQIKSACLDKMFV